MCVRQLSGGSAGLELQIWWCAGREVGQHEEKAAITYYWGNWVVGLWVLASQPVSSLIPSLPAPLRLTPCPVASVVSLATSHCCPFHTLFLQ